MANDDLQQRLDKGMYGTPIFEVSDKSNVQVVQAALCLADGIQIKEALGGVLIGPVAGIDDRHFRHFGCIAGAALAGVSHDNQVCVVADHQYCVFQGLTLGHATVGSIREPYDTSSELVGCTFKAEAGSGRGFEEQGGNNFVGQDSLTRILCEFFRHIQQVQLLFFAEVGD